MLMRGEEPPYRRRHGGTAFHQVGHEVSAPPPREPLILIAPQPAVQRVLDRSGMSRIFAIHPSREAALEAAAPAAG